MCPSDTPPVPKEIRTNSSGVPKRNAESQVQVPSKEVLRPLFTSQKGWLMRYLDPLGIVSVAHSLDLEETISFQLF